MGRLGGALQQNIHIWGPRHSPGISHQALPTQALHPPQCRSPLEPAPLKPLKWSTPLWGGHLEPMREGQLKPALVPTACTLATSLAPSCRIHQASWDTSVLCYKRGFYLGTACIVCEHQLCPSVVTCSAALRGFVTKNDMVSLTLVTPDTQPNPTGASWPSLTLPLAYRPHPPEFLVFGARDYHRFGFSLPNSPG